MKIERVSYSESTEILTPVGLKRWIKSSMDIELDSDDEVVKATELAIQYVEETIKTQSEKVSIQYITENNVIQVKEERLATALEVVSMAKSPEELADLHNIVYKEFQSDKKFIDAVLNQRTLLKLKHNG